MPGREASSCKDASVGFYVSIIGAINQTACPAGQYMDQTAWAEYPCLDCGIGTSTFDLVGQSYCPSCDTANTYRDGVTYKQRKEENKETGETQFVAYEHFYQDEEAQPACKACRFNKKKGAGECNVESGEITCLGFFREDTDCKKKQKIEQSIALAYVFFSLLILIGIPFMLFSGGLGAISHIWRKDTAFAIKMMREGTEHSLVLMKERMALHRRKVLEKSVLEAFKFHADLDGRANLDDLAPSIDLVIGANRRFAREFQKLIAAARGGDESSPPIRLGYAQFRDVLSIIAHRLHYAKRNELYHEVFRSFDEDGGGTLDEEEMQKVAATLGREFKHSEMQTIRSHSGRGGEIRVDDFVRAMHTIDRAERRSKLLEMHEVKEERYEKVFEEFKTEGKPDYLEPVWFRMAIATLGKIENVELLELARDKSPHISHFEAIQRGLPPRWAQKRLKKFDAGIWSLFTVVLCCLQLICDFISEVMGGVIYIIAVTMGLAIGLIFIWELGTKVYLFIVVHKSKSPLFAANPLNVVDLVATSIDILLILLLGIKFVAESNLVGGNISAILMSLQKIPYLLPIRMVRVLRLCRIYRSIRAVVEYVSQLGKIASEKITYTDYRRFLSTRCLHDSEVWPQKRWREGFQMFDRDEHGFIEASALDHGLLNACGVHLLETERAELRDQLDRGDGKLLFEDFIDAMSLYYDSGLENKVLAALDDPATKLIHSWRCTIEEILLFFAILIFTFIMNLAKLLVNLYLIAQSFYSEGLFPEKLAYFVAAFAEAVAQYQLPPFLVFIPWVAKAVIRVMESLAFVEIPVEAGVTCEGMQAPMYLTINYTIVALVILLFDSAMYVFLRVGTKDYKHQVSFVLHRLPFISPERARYCEEQAIKAVVIGFERGFKNVVQVIIAKIMYTRFMPIYGTKWTEKSNKFDTENLHKITEICESSFPGSETAAIYGATVVFYFTMPFMFHLLVNTFVFGLVPARIGDRNQQQEDEEDVEHGKAFDHMKRMSRARNTLVNTVDGYTSHHKDQSDEDDSKFYLYGRSMTLFKCVSPAWWCCSKQLDEQKDIEEEDVELFEHDPKFWQQPWQWMHYFVHTLGEGSYLRGAYLYFLTMRWKVWLLVKLTVGWWDDELASNLQIKKRAQQLDVDITDNDERHQAMISAVGEGHSIAWQFFPYCVFVSKAGEALNANPIFVYDSTVKIAIALAKEQQLIHKRWWEKSNNKEPLAEGWTEVESQIRPGHIYYFHVESGRTSYKRPIVGMRFKFAALTQNQEEPKSDNEEEPQEKVFPVDDELQTNDEQTVTEDIIAIVTGNDGGGEGAPRDGEDNASIEAAPVQSKRTLEEEEKAREARNRELLRYDATTFQELHMAWGSKPAVVASAAASPPTQQNVLEEDSIHFQRVEDWLKSLDRRCVHLSVMFSALECSTVGDVIALITKREGKEAEALKKLASRMKKYGTKASVVKLIVTSLRDIATDIASVQAMRPNAPRVRDASSPKHSSRPRPNSSDVVGGSELPKRQPRSRPSSSGVVESAPLYQSSPSRPSSSGVAGSASPSQPSRSRSNISNVIESNNIGEVSRIVDGGGGGENRVEELPDGWEAVPSKTRPGEVTYYHRETNTRRKRLPKKLGEKRKSPRRRKKIKEQEGRGPSRPVSATRRQVNKVAPTLPGTEGGAPSLPEDDSDDDDVVEDAFGEFDKDKRAWLRDHDELNDSARLEAALQGAMIQGRKSHLGQGRSSDLFEKSLAAANAHATRLSGSIRRSALHKKREEVQPGIWSLAIDDEDQDGLLENDRFWFIKVDRPEGNEAVAGEGMLVWFSEKSVIQTDDTSSAENDKDEAYAAFYSFSPDKHFGGDIKIHGDQFGYLEGRRLYGDVARSILSVGDDVHKEGQVADKLEFAGSPGNGLFGEKDAMYIPTLTCSLKFHSPGNTGSRFVVHCCYASESPLMMEEDKTARMFGWGCTVLSYATTLQICFSDDNAKDGVLLWLLINILEAVVTAAMKTMTHSLASDHSKKDLVSGKGYRLLFKRLRRRAFKMTHTISEEHQQEIKRGTSEHKAAIMLQKHARRILARSNEARDRPGEELDAASVISVDAGSLADSDYGSNDEGDLNSVVSTTTHTAARTIQTHVRGRLARTEHLKKMVARNKAATKIQKRARGNSSRRTAVDDLLKSVIEEDLSPLPPGWIEVKRTFELFNEGQEPTFFHRHYYLHERSGRRTKKRPVLKREDVLSFPKHDEGKVQVAAKGKRADSGDNNDDDDDDDDHDFDNHDDQRFIGAINDEELTRMLLTGPRRARNLGQAAEQLADHVMRHEFTSEECMEVLKGPAIHASNIHEARWRIDMLREELSRRYVARLRKKERDIFMGCLLEGLNLESAASADAGVAGVAGVQRTATGEQPQPQPQPQRESMVAFTPGRRVLLGAIGVGVVGARM